MPKRFLFVLPIALLLVAARAEADFVRGSASMILPVRIGFSVGGGIEPDMLEVQELAQSFSTTALSNGQLHRLDRIDLTVSENLLDGLLPGGATIFVAVHADDGGRPGLLVGQATRSDLPTDFWTSQPVEFDFAPVLLWPETSYWVVLSARPGSLFTWWTTTSPDDPATVALGRAVPGDWDVGAFEHEAWIRTTAVPEPDGELLAAASLASIAALRAGRRAS